MASVIDLVGYTKKVIVNLQDLHGLLKKSSHLRELARISVGRDVAEIKLMINLIEAELNRKNE